MGPLLGLGAETLVIEPFAIAPTYWTGVVSEVIAGHIHSTLFVEQRAMTGEIERVAVARLISPIETAVAANAMIRATLAEHFAKPTERQKLDA